MAQQNHMNKTWKRNHPRGWTGTEGFTHKMACFRGATRNFEIAACALERPSAKQAAVEREAQQDFRETLHLGYISPLLRYAWCIDNSFFVERG